MAIACAATSSALNIGSEMREAIIGKLCSVLEWENDLSRCCAIKALGQIGAQQAASSLIDRLLHDPDADVRMEAAAALGSLSVPQATEPLINALRHDPDGNARIEACLTLGKIGGPLAVEALIQALREDETLVNTDWDAEDEVEFDAAWEIQQKALEALGNIGDVSAVNAIIALIDNEDYEDCHELGFRVLSQIGAAQAMSFLLNQLKVNNRLARRRAATALSSFNDPQVVRALTHALTDQDADVRISAAKALAHNGDPAVIVPLTLLLKDGDAQVRQEASAALARLQGDEVGTQLLHLLSDENRSVRLQAVRLLGERKATNAAAPMLKLLADNPEAEFCEELVRALGQIAPTDAAAPLCEMLIDARTPPEVRLQAAFALGATVRASAGEVDADEAPQDLPDPLAALTRALADEDERLCFAALHSLVQIGGARASEALIDILQQEIPEDAIEPTNGDLGGEDNNAARIGENEAASSADEPGSSSEHRAKTPAGEETSAATSDGESDTERLDPQTSTLAAILAASAAAEDAEAVSATLQERERALDQQRKVRRYAARLMKELDDPKIVDALLDAATADDRQLEREAIISLGCLGAPKAVQLVLQKCTSDDREIRLAAIEALDMLKPEEAAETLRELVRSEKEDPFICQRAIEILAALGDRSAIDSMVERLRDDDRQVRRSALDALARLGQRAVIENIRPLIFDRSGDLRREAAVALKKLDDTEAASVLLATLDNPAEEEYHWIAIEALAELGKAD